MMGSVVECPDVSIILHLRCKLCSPFEPKLVTIIRTWAKIGKARQ